MRENAYIIDVTITNPRAQKCITLSWINAGRKSTFQCQKQDLFCMCFLKYMEFLFDFHLNS